MQSKAKTVAEYLRSLPEDRRATVAAVRDLVRANLDPLAEEGMQYGMIGWYIPHRVFPAGYHCDPMQPLPFVCLASQKNHISLYLMNLYADASDAEGWFRTEWAKSGKKLDLGKCCLRFKRVDDLALAVLARAIKRAKVKEHLVRYAAVDPRNRKAPPEKRRKPTSAESKQRVRPGRRIARPFITLGPDPAPRGLR